MRPAPPASVTVLIATVADLCDRDWKQRIAFPFAKVAFRLPELQLLSIIKTINMHFHRQIHGFTKISS